jgi:hypothetical protein
MLRGKNSVSSKVRRANRSLGQIFTSLAKRFWGLRNNAGEFSCSFAPAQSFFFHNTFFSKS